MKNKFSTGDKVSCPYCGKTGKVMKVWGDGSMDVFHEEGKRKVRSSSTGKILELNCFLDGCSRHGKLGKNVKDADDDEDGVDF